MITTIKLVKLVGTYMLSLQLLKNGSFKSAGTNRVENIEVGLMGQPKMLDTAQPLTDFSINKSMRLEDFNFAIDRVLSLIPNP